jgi:putative endonuclease
MRAHNYYVYILANKNNTVLYVGVTNNIERRLTEHKSKHNSKCFTARYNVDKLVYFEYFTDINLAILREKQLKAGSRSKKEALINLKNPQWVEIGFDFYTLT